MIRVDNPPSQARRERLARLAQYALHALLAAFFLFPLLFLRLDCLYFP